MTIPINQTRPTNFVSGWIRDPQRVAAVIAERRSRGDAVMSSTFMERHAQELPGTWERMKARGVTGVFLRDREQSLLGHYRRPFLQRAGTCVSRGMCRGVQTSLDVAIADHFELLKPVEVSFAPIYTMARHECGHDRCGRDDGAILADAARAVHDYGVATTALFHGMSEDSVEKLAVQYAAPGVGTPDQWRLAAKGHTSATFWPETLSVLFDCLAAGYAVPYAHNYVTGKPNSKGISDLGAFGPHCRCFVGLFLDENGETQLESSESWGRFPAGQPCDRDQTMLVEQIPQITLRYAGGEKRLAPGDVGVNAKRYWDQIQSGGEAWAGGPPTFEAETVSDIVARP
ncbi:MAG: hypothetical protein WCH39_16410 [Schlesneria sp.]